MNVKKVGKNITEVLEKNIRPLSNNLLPFKHGLIRKKELKNDENEGLNPNIRIEEQY